ncbi:M50 family metallopeptidase [Mycolicibacterium sp. XJ662]
MTATAERVVPRRADGVELIGELEGSGHRVAPGLVRRADGQALALTPLLYATLREVDGHRTPEEVADAVTAATGRSVNADNVSHLVKQRLAPMGLTALADGSEPQVQKRDPLLGLKLRRTITDPAQTRRLTDPFRFLFRPPIVVAVLAAFAVVCWWVCFHKGLAAAAYDAFERPGLLILVFVVTVLSAGFHEFGHAAAARYGGATPGVMGFGLYLVWPAFYTDVTDSYRLSRRGRLRTDLGGLYFNAIVAVAITALWLGLRYDALLLVVATQIIQMIRQLTPMVRFDGYHVLADLTGVPDLYGRIKPTLLGMLPWRWREPQANQLKWWARIVVTVWVVTVVPLLIAMLVLAVVALPRLLGSAWAAVGKQHDVLSSAWTDGDLVQVIARVLAMIAIVIPMAGIIYLLLRVARRIGTTAWQSSAGKPVQRAVVGLLGAAALIGIAYAWFPHGENYRPIQASDRGTISDIVYALRVEAMGEPRQAVTNAPRPVAATQPLAAGQRGVMQALWDTRTAPPTFNSPQLAVVVIPRHVTSVANGGGFFTTGAAAATQDDVGWVFPFDKPIAPEPGDGNNQALAVNTTDGTVVYDTAFALVWTTDEEYAMNVNEAHAYASCNSCAAVAVSYQVVFVIDQDDTNDNVAVPQNLSGALNYECVNCMTVSLARQLFVTLDEELSAEARAELEALWVEIDAYGDDIAAGKVPLNEIDGRLDEYTTEIMWIVEEDQPGTFPSLTPTTAAPTPTPVSVEEPLPSVPSPPSSTTTAAPEPTLTTVPAEPSETTVEETTSSPTTTNDPTPTQDSVTSEPTTESTGVEDATTAADTTPDDTASDATDSADTSSGESSSDGSSSDGSA